MSENPSSSWYAMSDQALSRQIGSFIRHHRLRQNRSQSDAAYAAGISRSTWSLLERGETVTLATLIQVLRVLDVLHVLASFTIQEQMSPLAMARQEKYKKQRAGRKRKDASAKSTW